MHTKILRSKLILVALIISGIIFISSCKKDTMETTVNTSIGKDELNKENVLLNDFAKLLAKSMSNEKGRSFIKNEALKEFDGDFDILFAEVKDKNLEGTVLKNSNHNTFGDFLHSFSTSYGKFKSNKDFNAFLDNLLKKYPLLQISIPEISKGSTENWDETSFTPLVALIPDDFDERTTRVIPAFDMYGNVSYLDINKYPEKPVIVVGRNERLVAIKKEDAKTAKSANIIQEPYCLEPYFETVAYEYYMPVNCEGSFSGDTGGGNTGGVPIYDRDNNANRDNLNKARFVSKTAYRQVEPWPDGRPEFKVIISYIEKVGDTYEAKTITKILTKNDWITRYVLWVDLKTKEIDLPIISWNKNIIGNSMKYTWIEQDNSDEQTELTIGYSSKFGKNNDMTINTSVKVTIGDKDDEAGEAVVEYKDHTTGEGTEYNTGIIRFWVNQL